MKAMSRPCAVIDAGSVSPAATARAPADGLMPFVGAPQSLSVAANAGG